MPLLKDVVKITRRGFKRPKKDKEYANLCDKLKNLTDPEVFARYIAMQDINKDNQNKTNGSIYRQ